MALGTVLNDPIIKSGSSTADMRRIVRNASRAFNHGPAWTLRVRKHGTLRQLKYWVKQGRWPIVQVFVPESMEFHAVVVLEVEPDRVRVFDPDPSFPKQLSWISADRFLEWWASPTDGKRWWSVINGGDLVQYE